MKVAILASGNGTNFEVLAQHFKNNDLPGELALLFCNHPDDPVMKRAARLGIPAESFTVKSCGGKQEYEEKLLGVLKKYQIDFIALAGYLRVLGPLFWIIMLTELLTFIQHGCQNIRDYIRLNGHLLINKPRQASPYTILMRDSIPAQLSPRNTSQFYQLILLKP